MPTLISHPTVITSAGNKPKLIEEFIGRVNSQNRNGQHRQNEKPGRLG